MKKYRLDKEFFWFETGKCDKENYLSFYFHDPVKILTLTQPKKLQQFFNQIEELSQKYYLAGFFSYELGYLFEDIFQYKKVQAFPYAVFHVYKKPVIINHKKAKPDKPQSYPFNLFSIDKNLNYEIKNLKLNIKEQEYLDTIDKIRNYIYKGDIFQANYTVKYKFNFSGSALGLYQDLKRKQNVSYNVFAGIGDYYILSLSPELYFAKNKNDIITKPMKGTMKRGNDVIEDNENRLFLYNDGKNRSENVMIVDLLRNDIGKISKYGSVKVSKLFEIEKYDTLFQMTSTIKSKLRDKTSLYKLIKSIFPCGSITGAPKIRSMEIIRELEKEERKVYTGAIGFFQPGGIAKFNVAIRTILLNKNKGEMGVGGGIVYDSRPDDEFKECKLKDHFLVRKPLPEIQLIETILFDKNCKYSGTHLQRLKNSAEYFDFQFNKKEILSRLKMTSKHLHQGRYKVRLLLDKAGNIFIEHKKLGDIPIDYKITISKYRTDSNDAFYYHKTTNRQLYNQELEKIRKKGFYDVIFLNEKGEITEGSITNTYVKKKGFLYTPPIKCGLLNGIIRQAVLKKNQKIKEKIILTKDLSNADAVYISNSIIGFQKARFLIS